jgi:hypothetical protein
VRYVLGILAVLLTTTLAHAQDCDWVGEILHYDSCKVESNLGNTDVFIGNRDWYYRFYGTKAEKRRLVYTYYTNTRTWIRDYTLEDILWSGGQKPGSGSCRENYNKLNKPSTQSWDITDGTKLCLY